MSVSSEFRRHWYVTPEIIIPGAALIGVAIVAVPALIVTSTSTQSLGETWSARVRACDQAVEALLHSGDLVEVTRAGIIIDRLDCSIGRRLP